MDKIKMNFGGVIVEVDKEIVSKAIETGEVIIQDDSLVIYEKSSFEQFKTNLSNEEYKKGKQAGEEMPFKYEALKEKYGVEVTGKTLDNFAEAFKAKVLNEARIEPSKKIQELESDKANLLKNYQNLESEFNGFKTTITQKETQIKKDNTLLSFIPDAGLKVSKDIALLALKSKGIDISFDESGKVIPTRNGEPLKDMKTMEPLSLSDLIPMSIKELGLIEDQKGGGNGGGDDTGKGGASNYDRFVDEMKKNGIDEGQLKFSEEMNKRIKEGTLKI